VVRNLAQRVQIREWLINPPQPPFEIVLAESGQKHLLPFARVALNRDKFPVLFEQDVLQVDRNRFIRLLAAYERLLALGFSKTEIDTGNWRTDRLSAVLSDWWELEEVVQGVRGTRLLSLVSFVAQRPETVSATPQIQKPELKPVIEPPKVEVIGQLNLF
jgi:CRISPR type IV-associated protein Csf1